MDTGNLFRWSVLIGKKDNKTFIESFKDDSFFDMSLIKAKMKIKRKFRILYKK